MSHHVVDATHESKSNVRLNDHGKLPFLPKSSNKGEENKVLGNDLHRAQHNVEVPCSVISSSQFSSLQESNELKRILNLFVKHEVQEHRTNDSEGGLLHSEWLEVVEAAELVVVES